MLAGGVRYVYMYVLLGQKIVLLEPRLFREVATFFFTTFGTLCTYYGTFVFIMYVCSLVLVFFILLLYNVFWAWFSARMPSL